MHENWLQRFEDNHRNIASPWVYWVSLPLVALGMIGLLWSLPIPAAFAEISPLLNWGSAFLMAAAVYYFIISLPLAIGLMPLVLGTGWLQLWLVASPYSIRRVAAGMLIAGLAGLLMGHRRGRPLRATLEDLQTIMIGPAWALSVIYRRAGIPY